MLNTIGPKACHLPLIVPFLKQFHHHNIVAVNDALNELYVEV